MNINRSSIEKPLYHNTSINLPLSPELKMGQNSNTNHKKGKMTFYINSVPDLAQSNDSGNFTKWHISRFDGGRKLKNEKDSKAYSTSSITQAQEESDYLERLKQSKNLTLTAIENKKYDELFFNIQTALGEKDETMARLLLEICKDKKLDQEESFRPELPNKLRKFKDNISESLREYLSTDWALDIKQLRSAKQLNLMKAQIADEQNRKQKQKEEKAKKKETEQRIQCAREAYCKQNLNTSSSSSPTSYSSPPSPERPTKAAKKNASIILDQQEDKKKKHTDRSNEVPTPIPNEIDPEKERTQRINQERNRLEGLKKPDLFDEYKNTLDLHDEKWNKDFTELMEADSGSKIKLKDVAKIMKDFFGQDKVQITKSKEKGKGSHFKVTARNHPSFTLVKKDGGYLEIGNRVNAVKMIQTDMRARLLEKFEQELIIES